MLKKQTFARMITLAKKVIGANEDTPETAGILRAGGARSQGKIDQGTGSIGTRLSLAGTLKPMDTRGSQTHTDATMQKVTYKPAFTVEGSDYHAPYISFGDICSARMRTDSKGKYVS